ncbi:MAG: LLM class F420-dependent oxidoreductase [Myxococcota bacterium]
MKFWQALSFSEPDQLLELAPLVEQAGFEGALVSDHLFFPGRLESKYPYSEDGVPGFDGETPFPECWSTIAAMAAVTRSLRFSTMVHILPLRNPIEVARVTGTVAVLSKGRVCLGAGAGWIREEFDVLGVPFERRGRRFDECIEVLRKLWAGGLVEHHGEHVGFPPIQMSPAPAEPVPILIGGVSGPALRRAARLGDGWLGSGQTPDEVLDIVGRLTELRAEAGRRDQPFEVIAPLTVAPDPDTLKRLEDAGVTGTVSYPFLYTLGPTSTLDAKRAYLEQFAENVIAKLG